MRAPLLRRRSAAGLALIVMATTLALIPSAPASAHSCAEYPFIRLGSFALDDPASGIPTPIPPSFYWVQEGNHALFSVWADEWCQGTTSGSVDWQTIGGTAISNVDFTQSSGNIPVSKPAGGDQHAAFQDFRDFATTADGMVDAPLETFSVKLTEKVGKLQDPKEAPIHIVDVDGSMRFTTVGGGPFSVFEKGGKFKLPVFRAGPANSSASVGLTYIGGTNGIDFDGPTQVTFGTSGLGARFQVATITAKDDLVTEANQTITVELAEPTDGAKSMSFTIIDNDGGSGDLIPPVTWFHHPKHNKDYKHGSLKARTIHVFIPVADKDNAFGPAEPSGIDTTQFALRRKKTGGACQWWTAGRDWQGGKCGSPNWITYKGAACGTYISDRDLCEYDLKKDLAPSKGTKIRNYRVLSRAKDGSGNWEGTFEVGRNKNTFEINKK